jgi:hypothetical protein
VTPQQVVGVAFRLFAIWLALHAMGYVPSFFRTIGSESPFVYMAFLLALNAVIILALWFFPLVIAGKLIPSQAAQSHPSVTAESWLAIGCTLIGLWTLTTTIPQLVYNLYALNSMSGSEDPAQTHQALLYYVVQLAIAVWLVLGGKGVGKLFQWAQDAGVKKDL